MMPSSLDEYVVMGARTRRFLSFFEPKWYELNGTMILVIIIVA
jgi:hypothetical protein